MTETLCIATARNRPGRHDGDYFVSEMNRFAAFMEDNGCEFVGQRMYEDKNRYRLRSQTVADVQDFAGFDTFACFMHGSWKWLYGTGHQIWNCSELARTLAISCDKGMDLTVILYSCSCGRGRNRWARTRPVMEREHIYGYHGFAHRLSSELGMFGVRAKVFAHTARGDTTRNPLLCMVTTDPASFATTTVYYRDYIKYHAGRAGWKSFCNLMRKHKDFRFRVPFMTMADVINRITV